MIKLLFSDPPCYLGNLAPLAAVPSIRALCSSLEALQQSSYRVTCTVYVSRQVLNIPVQ